MRATKQDEVPFYKHQMRVLLEYNGWIDPNSIDDYIAVGGYKALAEVLDGMEPEQVLAAILNPFHRPVDFASRERNEEIFGVEFAAHAKTAAARHAATASMRCRSVSRG